MSIATQIGRIAKAKKDIKEVINQDFEIINNETIDKYAEKIESAYDEYESYVPWEYGEGSEFTFKKGGAGSYLKELEIKGNTIQSELPSEYTQVDYIESSGEQYIDTNYLVNPLTKVETIYQFTNTEIKQQRIFGTFGSVVFTSYINGSGYFAWSCSDNNGKWQSTGIIADEEKHKITIDVLNSLVTLDSYNKTIDPALTNTSNHSLLLFGYRGTSSYSPVDLSNLKMYSTKMYENEILIYDFIPCYRNSDNVVGLYDLVNNVFYTNQGTGVFTYGSIAPTPDNPIDIKVVENKQVVNVSGKNKYGITSVSSHNYASGLPASQNNNMIIDNYDLNNIQFHSATNNYLIALLPTYQLIPNTEYIISYTRTNELIEGAYARRYIYSVDDNNNYSLINVLNSGDNGNMSYQFTTSKTGKTAIAFGFNNNSNGSSSTVNNLMIRLATESDDSFEPYHNQDYEIDLKSKNLFNFDSIISAYYNSIPTSRKSILTIDYINKTLTINSDNNDTYIPIIYTGVTNHSEWNISLKKNTDYTISYQYSNTDVEKVLIYALKEDNNTYVGVTGTDIQGGKTFNTGNYSEICIRFGTKNDNGNSCIISNIQLEEGTTATKYETYCDYKLCKIENYSDKIKKSTEKNLFNKNSIVVGKRINPSGEDYTDANYSRSNYIEVIPNTIYTKNLIASAYECVAYYKKDYTFISRNTTEATFKTPDDCYYIKVSVHNDNIDIAQLEKGSTATEYEPYGKWYIKKEINKVVLNGSETWLARSADTTSYNRFVIELNGNIIKTSNASEKAKIYSDKFIGISRTDTYNKHNGFAPSVQTSDNYYRDLVLYYDYVAQMSIEDFKAWLSNNPVMVYYVLATPVYETITNSTLINQLDAIEKLDTYNNYTAVTATGDLVDPELECVLFSQPAYQKWVNNKEVN